MLFKVGIPTAPSRLVLRHATRSITKESATQSNQVISNKQLLYTTDPLTPGSIFFLPHGTRIFNKLVQFMKNQQIKYGFQEVITPLIYKNKLWKQSGHWENYSEDMFKVMGNVSKEDHEVQDVSNEAHEHHHEHEHNAEDEEYGLKPMNCPGHCLIYAKFDRSYNELPIRYSDFSSLHRNEASGALSGLTRVRRFHQDDGHIFCQLEQIEQEISNTINLIKNTYGVFGIETKEIEFHLSTRPEKYIGDAKTWDNAEEQLTQVLNKTTGENSWKIREGDGAFYGPKIDVLLTDAFEKKHQVGTIQLDFQLPTRFNLKYVGEEGNRDHQPILVHRAVFGSLERFFAILLDHYQGKWPFWLNPRQAIIIPVNEKHVGNAEALQKELSGDILNHDEVISPMTGYNFYVDIDKRNETVGNRIKEAIQKGYSYILMLGDKDIELGTVAIRSRDNRKVSNLTSQEVYKMFIDLEKHYK
ncbi:threonyl-tRNA synthetase [Suhomyces tanzawaensis NRRL Y-17324]|uniref:threonine--tRNA ligase n=1 Tax=Suhomyces tanzawaensis NRRL Y-17324 TaxID=984487 RepID=A0A1E4SMU1_9ASCO|nr:threonyl-tRNA synthetase [Suhomyces tanzawaensis NRRL Y-17324]ODV80815.1 threonyl-tRNA synthetase [Suhomyces tanzawaensis NRRL Y-17324]